MIALSLAIPLAGCVVVGWLALTWRMIALFLSQGDTPDRWSE